MFCGWLYRLQYSSLTYHCTLFNYTKYNVLKHTKVAKSIKSKVAKQHKYTSGDIVAAAKEAKLAANKSSIKAALSSKKPAATSKSKESFAAKLKKQGGQFNDIPIGRGSFKGRGELVNKSSVDGGSTSSSKYTRRTTYGSGKRSIRGGVMKQQSYDDPLDVAAAAQRSSNYQDSVGSTRTKAAAAAMKRAKRGTAKAAAEKKQPPIKKSRGAKSSSLSGGCSLSNVGCNKAVDNKVAAKSYSSTTSTTKSTKSTTSASTKSESTTESPSAIEKNLSKLRMAAKNAAKSAAAKSNSSTSKSTASSTQKTQKGPWQCDFCFTAKFDSYNDEAKKHEECCEVRIILSIMFVVGMWGELSQPRIGISCCGIQSHTISSSLLLIPKHYPPTS